MAHVIIYAEKVYKLSVLSNTHSSLGRPRILVIYQYIALYRLPVFFELSRSPSMDFEFMSGGPFKGATVRIATQQEREGLVHHEARNVWLTSAVLWQRAVIPAVRSGRYDAIIMLGDPHYLSTWAGALVARMRGTPVLFWSIGVRNPQPILMRMIKRWFYRLPQINLVYDSHAVTQMRAELGITGDIRTIYNSLDFDAHTRLFKQLNAASQGEEPQRQTIHLLSVGRLTERRRLDLVVDAMAILRDRGVRAQFTIVGDGAARSELEAGAAEHNLAEQVQFRGAIYDNAAVAHELYHADMLVSPGQIGLAGIHAHGLGCPVLTLTDRSNPAPEVEVIENGTTGVLIETLTAKAVADGIEAWLAARGRDRASVRVACRERVAAHYTPAAQTELIMQAIRDVLDA